MNLSFIINSFLVKHVTTSHKNTEFGKKLAAELKIWNKTKNKTKFYTEGWKYEYIFQQPIVKEESGQI